MITESFFNLSPSSVYPSTLGLVLVIQFLCLYSIHFQKKLELKWHNQSYFQNYLKVTTEHLHFAYKDHKIVCMYDPLHTLKNVVSNLKENEFLIYVSLEAPQDRSSLIRCASKLIEMYFDFSIFSSKRVQTAAQMLIYSVARDITLFASLNSIPSECTTNGEFGQLVWCI